MFAGETETSLLKRIFKKTSTWLVIGASWFISLPTLISPLWTISGFLLRMFLPLGAVQMFRVFLGLEPYHIRGWDPWLRFYIPWIPLITCPETLWLVDSRIYLPSHEWEMVLEWIGAFLIFFGITLLIAGLVQIVVAKIRGTGLVKKGLYAWVRHPQYLGIIIWIFGDVLYGLRPIDFILWTTLAFLYLLLAESEERTLVKEYGEEYLVYQKQVPFILPFMPSKPLAWFNKLSQEKGWRKVTIYFGIYLLTVTLLLLFLKAVTPPLSYG